MSDQLDTQPGLVRTHSVCHTFCWVPVVTGILSVACFATGALVPVGVVLLLISILLGAAAWILSMIDARYDKTHHYDLTNE